MNTSEDILFFIDILSNIEAKKIRKLKLPDSIYKTKNISYCT